MIGRWILSVAAAVALGGAAAGCGGDGAKPGPATTATTAAADPPADAHELAARLSRYTGIPMEATNLQYLGSTIRVQEGVPYDRQRRFAVFTATWTQNERVRADQFDDTTRGRDGWYRGAAGKLLKGFGPRLVLRTYDSDGDPALAPDVQALERAFRAAWAGQPELLPAAERSCDLQHLQPLHSPPGACALDGRPTTFVDAGDKLHAGPLDVRLTGFAVTGAVSSSTFGRRTAPSGHRYVVADYRVRNTGSVELSDDAPTLRVGGRDYEADIGVSLAAGRGSDRLTPGGETATSAALVLPTDVADRVRDDGVLVLPAGLLSRGYLDERVAQGWIRLADAPRRRSAPAPTAAPAPAPTQPSSPGPPEVPVREGSGMAYGEAARAAYYAGTFFPMPKFQRGPITAGTRAGGCRVPALTGTDRDQIAALARAADPRDRFHGLRDASILLAECGAMGDHGIVFWGHTTAAGHDVITGTEIIRRHGRWVERGGQFEPGCTVPLDAAAAWQIDVSPCPADAPRPHPAGDTA